MRQKVKTYITQILYKKYKKKQWKNLKKGKIYI